MNTTDIPKIQLESKEDVDYLQTQLTSFLRKTVENSTTLRDSGLTAEQKAEAEQLILSKLEQWASGVWKTAAPNITVNGFAYEEALREKSRIEPLDETLKNEVVGLRDEADTLLLAVANKRRTVPGQIERLVGDAVWRDSVAAEHTRAIRGLESNIADDELPFVDSRVNGDFEDAVGLALRVKEEAPGNTKRLEQLIATLEESRCDDAEVRGVVGQDAGSGSDTQQQLLAYKAALHAVTRSAVQ
ncbi:hypothetical protein GGI25_002007 [Coemansia spiralis]|uniref:Uncharacterized protein n=2 Tax=Coemansia TaxID=4863 RepID=A0A9W8G8Q3_9FUNG|nr:hypothetical protein BX070DRAFT_227896 [Coemansia spiralis]KAJ1992674.1 hypothetical protein EDC05_002617 [Coemansia umbellata]KAJ2623263.1 hypothetical protein GGI26_002490 [Coemansia sp. RSA 1358]KAJ2678815.1 hypothetical protein GGI25_002007 [Coemansia spiralis]